MVCPNCQSKDIVELQGQHFCINCGRLIELITKKRGPGRPKADRLDRPKPVTLQLAGKMPASIDAPAEIGAEEKNTDQAETQTEADVSAVPVKAVATKPKDDSTAIIHGYKHIEAPQLPSEIAKVAEVKARKRLQDIVPASSEDTEEQNIDLENAVIRPVPKLALSPIVASAWSEPWQGGPARVLAAAAVLAAVTSGFLSYVLFWHSGSPLGPVLLTGMLLVMTAIGLLFGIANTERASTALRRYDHRPVPRSWLFGAALSVLSSQILVLLAGMIEAAVVLAASYAAAIYIPPIVSRPFSAVVLLSGYFILGLLLLAIWTQTGLSAAGVELGRMKVAEAIKFGWGSIVRHPDLLGTRLVAALWLGASLSGIIAIAWILHFYIPGYDRWIIAGGTSTLALTASFLGNFGSVGWRQAAYRETVILDQPDQAIALLSGHHNGAPRNVAKYAFAVIVSILTIAGIMAILSSLYR